MLDVVAVSNPDISDPAESVFPTCCNCCRLGTGRSGLSTLFQEPSVYSAATVSTSKNHLTRPGSVGIGDFNQWAQPFHLFPVDPLTGASWKGLALQEHGHRVLIQFGARCKMYHLAKMQEGLKQIAKECMTYLCEHVKVWKSRPPHHPSWKNT